MINCSELSIKIKELAMRIAEEKGLTNLDEVIEEIQIIFPELHRTAIVEAIVEATTREHKELTELQKNLAGIRRQAKSEKALRDNIKKLETLLDAEILPETAAKTPRTNETLKQLQQVQKDLKKELKDIEPARVKQVQNQIDNLLKKIESGDILPKTKTELEPKTKELEDLIYKRDLIKDEIRDMVYRLQPKTLAGYAGDVFDTIRLFQTTGEFSLFLRQGGWYTLGHPVKAFDALIKSFKAFANDQYSRKINHQLLNRPLAALSNRAGLQITPIDGSVALSKMEEALMSHWSNKIPGIKNFTRAGLTLLNLIRANSFDTMYETIGRTKEVSLADAELIAGYTNVSTGRGSLGSAEKHAVLLNRVFYAPKYVASRFQLLLGHPVWAKAKSGTASKEVRKLIAKEYARSLISLGIFYLLASLLPDDEVEIETDPRSSDFGKLKIGDTRIDPLMGLSQNTVLLSRLITGEIKSTSSGNVRKLYGEARPYGGSDIWDVIANFGRYKLSPTFGIPLNVIARQDPIGKEYTIKDVPFDLVPITWGEIYESMREQGVPKGTALAIMAFFGIGLQTYQD